ncbi:MAG TPA: hypothetical protein VHB18_05575 [Mycobacteriales bacterium]|jgi:hypothetical protein|nr:hypothetical protein [Mycobacteriales bacterium]
MTRKRSSHLVAPLGVVLAITGVVGSTSTAVAAGRAAQRPQVLGPPRVLDLAPAAVRDPARNLPPVPDYVPTCASNWRSKKCTREALSAIARARVREGVKKAAMKLPDNFGKLSVAEQTFVVTNLERVARGMKPFRGLTRALNNASHLAAVLSVDPAPAISLLRLLGITEYGSVWAGDFGPLASDYDWMYNDGYAGGGSINLDCLTPKSAGCWGHRQIILGGYHSNPTLLAGAGTARPAGASIAEVLTGGRGRPPKLTYSWHQAVRHGAANLRASSWN